VLIAGGVVQPLLAQDGAQNETTDRLLACDAITDSTERMNCFNAVVEGLNQDSESSAVADAEPVAKPPEPASAESPPLVTAPVAAGTAATAIPTGSAGAPAAPSPSAPAAESPGTSPTSASDESPAVEASQDNAIAEFGLEDQKAQAEKKVEIESEVSEIHSTIVRSEKSGQYHFVVELDNGQVWEETDGSRRIGLPKVGMPVRIYPGKLAGYRMKIGSDNRIAWVRRLK